MRTNPSFGCAHRSVVGNQLLHCHIRALRTVAIKQQQLGALLRNRGASVARYQMQN